MYVYTHICVYIYAYIHVFACVGIRIYAYTEIYFFMKLVKILLNEFRERLLFLCPS